jgi:hypothetical protein
MEVLSSGDSSWLDAQRFNSSLADLQDFIHSHRLHGTVTADATPNGYLLTMFTIKGSSRPRRNGCEVPRRRRDAGGDPHVGGQAKSLSAHSRDVGVQLGTVWPPAIRPTSGRYAQQLCAQLLSVAPTSPQSSASSGVPHRSNTTPHGHATVSR